MASRWETIGDAIVTSLNAASLGQTFTSVRAYRPDTDLTALEAATQASVYVIPESRESDTVSRTPIQARDYFFSIEIHRFISDPATIANVDTWMTFAESVEDHLMGAGNMGAGVWMGSNSTPPLEPESLFEEHVFQSTILVQYRVKQG